MSNLPTYTKTDIHNAAGAIIFERGEEYCKGGMVKAIVSVYFF